MPDFEQKIQHCYHNQFFVTKDMGKNNFHRSCLERINLSWFVTTLSSAKTKHLLGILICRHFDAVCFYGAHSFSRGNHASDLKHAQSFCRCVSWPRLFKGWITLSIGYIQRIAWFVLLTLIRWIAIYPVDSVIQPLNNRGLDSSFARPGSAPIWGGEKGEFRDWTNTVLKRYAIYGVSISWT